MPRVSFTRNLQRRVVLEPALVEGATVKEALEAAFRGKERARSQVLDDQGELRPHILVFVDGVLVRDRWGLTDPVAQGAEIHVMQALSGG